MKITEALHTFTSFLEQRSVREATQNEDKVFTLTQEFIEARDVIRSYSVQLEQDLGREILSKYDH
jgi:hypothetical protein